MKILVDGMPKEAGGIGTLLINIVNYNIFVGNGAKYEFEFLLPYGSEYITTFGEKKIKYYEVPRITQLNYFNEIKKVFDNENYDYLWINNTSKVNILLPSVAKKKGVKIISHSHGVSCEETGLKKIIFKIAEKIFERKYCNMIDIPFACSEASADYFYHDELRKKCIILHNGILVNKFKFNMEYRKKIRSEFNVNINDILLGAVGRITKVKNFPFLIQIMQQLPDKFKLFIVGDGEDRTVLVDLIDKNQLGNRVYLLGVRNDVEKVLSAMDIFVMPSLNEGMPFALIEAQASGLKCVVSNGVSKESKIIDEVYYVSLNSIDEWLEKIMYSSINERILCARKIEEAGYSIEKTYETLIEILNKRLEK